jgi:hypothetical protein
MRRSTMRVPMTRALPALILWAFGCQVLIDGDLGTVHCEADGTVGPPACPVGSECKEGLCVPSSLGTACSSDEDCAPGDFCFDPEPFCVDDGNHCSRTCCASTDCDPHDRFVCWTPEQGGGAFCRDASNIGREIGGSARARETCGENGECRSGLCTDGRCLDGCCSDAGCNGGKCRFGRPLADQAPGFWCGAASNSGKGRYEPCVEDAECASGLCLAMGSTRRCSVPCCTSSACEAIPGEDVPVACSAVAHGGTLVRACAVLLQESGEAETGSACALDTDCRSGICLTKRGVSRCTDACCSDGSCGDPSSFGCKPAFFSMRWALRCEPK